MRYSKQRELIVSTLRENVVHPTADYIYSLVRAKCPQISLATVYRNLNQLAESGDIVKIQGLDGSVHYDWNTHKHYHFICTKCKKVYDIDYDIAPELAQKVSEKTGLVVEEYDTSFKGICHHCKKIN